MTAEKSVFANHRQLLDKMRRQAAEAQAFSVNRKIRFVRVRVGQFLESHYVLYDGGDSAILVNIDEWSNGKTGRQSREVSEDLWVRITREYLFISCNINRGTGGGWIEKDGKFASNSQVTENQACMPNTLKTCRFIRMAQDIPKKGIAPGTPASSTPAEPASCPGGPHC